MMFDDTSSENINLNNLNHPHYHLNDMRSNSGHTVMEPFESSATPGTGAMTTSPDELTALHQQNQHRHMLEQSEPLVIWFS